MKNIKLIALAILFVGITFFTSCDSRTQQDLEGIVLNPTYNQNVKKILDNKCVTCHSPSSSQQAFPDLDTYQNVVDYQKGQGANGYSNGLGTPSLLCSIQVGSCTSDRMPKGDAALSNGSITIIANWINNNYPEN